MIHFQPMNWEHSLVWLFLCKNSSGKLMCVRVWVNCWWFYRIFCCIQKYTHNKRKQSWQMRTPLSPALHFALVRDIWRCYWDTVSVKDESLNGDCIPNQWCSIEHAYNVIIARRARDGDHSMQSSKQKYLYSHCRLTPRWAGEHMNAPDKNRCCRLRFVTPNNLHVTVFHVLAVLLFLAPLYSVESLSLR